MSKNVACTRLPVQWERIYLVVDTLTFMQYIVHMESVDFVWDAEKDEQNQKKHSVSFEEAKTVFFDEYALQFYDPDHSIDEDRFILLGMSAKLRVVIVCHCFREEEEIIRIISARKADKPEERSYWEKRK